MGTYKNTGLLFYKHYFDDTDLKHYDRKSDQERVDEWNKNLIDKKNNVIFDSVLDNTDNKSVGKQQFELTTVYPGLFTGSGYPHEANIEGELKLGFFFDYTTGLPVIPGSSVKGILRDAFEKADGEYVKELLGNIGVKSDDIINMFEKVKVEGHKEKVPFIVKHIFYGYTRVKEEKDGNEVILDKELNVYQKDKFFDAFPVGEKDSRQFLADDYITPHHENPLKNPVPLRFLKVLPNVTFRFDFELHDLKDENAQMLVSAEQKLKLFKQILLDLGIGAKTNVGYGQFRDQDEVIDLDSPDNATNEDSLNPGLSREDLNTGDKIKAKIIDLSSGVTIDLYIPGISFKPRLTGVSPKIFKVGQIIEVEVIINGTRFNFNYKT